MVVHPPSSLMPVWTALLLAIIGLAGGWQWFSGLAERGPASAAPGLLESARRPVPVAPTAFEGAPPPLAGPGLGSTQKQFAAVQQAIAEPDAFPLGLPAEGKAGMVRSPHAPDQGFVDVAGLPSGTKVRCPYTTRIFLVP